MKNLLLWASILLLAMTPAIAGAEDDMDETSDSEVYITEDFDFEAEYEDNTVFLEWNSLETDDFMYYKIMASQENDNPTYPEEHAIKVLEDQDETELEIKWPRKGTTYYRICMVTENKDVFCSENVAEIEIEDENEDTYEEMKKKHEENKRRIEMKREEMKKKHEENKKRIEEKRKEMKERYDENKKRVEMKREEMKERIKNKRDEIDDKIKMKRKELREKTKLATKLADRLESKLDEVYKKVDSKIADAEKKVIVLERFIKKLEDKHGNKEKLRDVLDYIIWDMEAKIEEYKEVISEDYVDDIFGDLDEDEATEQ